MSSIGKKQWWDELPRDLGSERLGGGDVITGQIGDHNRNIAFGKNITQTVYEILGGPQPDDREVVKDALAKVKDGLDESRGQLNSTIAQFAEMQLKLLQAELVKSNGDQVPSANTITMVGDWLLDNVPAMLEILTDFFATPAVGKLVGKAGDLAVKWVRTRFGKK